MRAQISKESIKVLPVFKFMSDYVDEEEMFRTFNMGVGMILVVDGENVEAVCANSDAYVIGAMIKGEKDVDLI
jgi:phosphoribosylformylglycinamidine cyclo-ligase